jgi:hypothetical protein
VVVLWEWWRAARDHARGSAWAAAERRARVRGERSARANNGTMGAKTRRSTRNKGGASETAFMAAATAAKSASLLA